MDTGIIIIKYSHFTNEEIESLMRSSANAHNVILR